MNLNNYFFSKLSNIRYLLVGLIFINNVSNTTGEDFPRVAFTVNPDHLSEPFNIDDSFVIQLPIGWNEVDQQAFHQFKQAVEKDTSSLFRFHLVKIFKSENGASSVIVRILNNEPAFQLLDSDYEENLKLTFQSTDVARGAFSINGVNTIQYRIINQDLIVYKLFCQIDTNFFQIDYFIPAKIFETEIKKIESSIGSITKKDKKEGSK